PAVVVRGAEDEAAADLEHARQFVERLLLRGDVFDYLGTDDAIEAGIGKRQLEDRPVYELVPIAARVAQLVELDVEPGHARDGTKDATRTAADVENGGEAVGHSRDRTVTPTLPVALQRDDAVVGAGVVVRRGDRI